MRDVTLQPFGVKTALGIIGVVGYKNKLSEDIKKSANELQKQKSYLEEQDQAFNQITISMLDKRYKTSKEFMKNFDRHTDLRFKKSLTNEDEMIFRTISKNLVMTKRNYENQYNAYNKKIQRMHSKVSLKEILKRAV